MDRDAQIAVLPDVEPAEKIVLPVAIILAVRDAIPNAHLIVLFIDRLWYKKTASESG